MATALRAMPAHRSLARRLGQSIVTGRQAVGSLLPGEIEMAETLGISRSVVREALRTLAAKGLVESRPKAGTRIRERSGWNLLDPELLGWMFESAPPPGFVTDLFALRLIVEPAGAEIAAAKRSAEQLARMADALDAMATHGLSSEAGRAADQAFHALILEATGNELLASLSASIAAAVHWTTYFKYRLSRKPRDPMPQHRRLYDAIAAGDPAAAREAAVLLVRQAGADTEDALAMMTQEPDVPAATTD